MSTMDEFNISECDLKSRMHVLANKLLPITVFSQLAVRQCHDPQIMKHLQKIQLAAEEARVIVAEIQSLDRIGLRQSHTKVATPWT